jgi:uncharacterized membrane protein
MRPWVKVLIGLVALAAIAHVAIIFFAPYVIMRGDTGSTRYASIEVASPPGNRA